MGEEREGEGRRRGCKINHYTCNSYVYHHNPSLLSHSNESLFDAGTYYSGVYVQNTSVDIRPTPDVFYILNFDNILRSYGM